MSHLYLLNEMLSHLEVSQGGQVRGPVEMGCPMSQEVVVDSLVELVRGVDVEAWGGH